MPARTPQTGRLRAVARALPPLLILVFGLYLRLEMVDRTVVESPLRADAREYYAYAYHLTVHGVYSGRASPRSAGAPSPDAARNPGYPLFLTLFVEEPPTGAMLDRITTAQAILSALTIALALGLFRTFLPRWPALAAALLTALSPHLVVMNVYVLSETLFTLFLVAGVGCLAALVRRRGPLLPVAAGVLLGCSALVRPTMSLFPLWLAPALFALLPARRALRAASLLLLGFALAYGPWLARNALVDAPDSSVALRAIHQGMYPGLMYRGDPSTRPYPYFADPTWQERDDFPEVLAEIGRRFADRPVAYAAWYLIGKPSMFLSFDIVDGAGDVFVYPVKTSAYHESQLPAASRSLMRVLNAPIVLAAFATCVFVWLPRARRRLGEPALFAARCVALVLAYFLVLHVAALPLPRYATPLRPMIHGAALLGLWLVVQRVAPGRGDEGLARSPTADRPAT